jgi:signal transduction histidine kinase
MQSKNIGPLELTGQNLIGVACDYQQMLLSEICKNLLRPVARTPLQLFEVIAEGVSKYTQADCAIVWENSFDLNLFTLKAGFPKNHLSSFTETNSWERSVGFECVFSSDLCDLNLAEIDAQQKEDIPRKFENHRLVLVPIPCWSDPQLTLAVIYLFFPNERHKKNFPCESVEWISKCASLALDHLVIELHDSIRRFVDSAVRGHSSIQTILNQVQEELIKYMDFDRIVIVSVCSEMDRDRKSVVVEASNVPRPQATAGIKSEICVDSNLKCSHPPLSIESWMFEVANDGQLGRLTKQMLSRTHNGKVAHNIAAPICNTSGDVIAVLVIQRFLSRQTKKFTTLDSEAACIFASALSPAIDRIINIKENGSPLYLVAKASISQLAKENTSFEGIAESIINQGAHFLHADYGAVYLLSQDVMKLLNSTKPKKRTGIDQENHKRDYDFDGEIVSKVASTKTPVLLQGAEEIGFFLESNHIRDDSFKNRCSNVICIPIISREYSIGVLLFANSAAPHENCSTLFSEDEFNAAKALSVFLAFVYSQERLHLEKEALLIEKNEQTEQVNKLSKVLTTSVLAMHTADSEDDIILAGMNELELLGYEGLLSIYDVESLLIVGRLAVGSSWNSIVNETRRPIDGDDILAICLRSNIPEILVLDDRRVDPFTAKMCGVKSFYVLPLRVGDELIGTLQIDLKGNLQVKHPMEQMFHAIAASIAVAISRARARKNSLDFASRASAEARFVAAEALSGMTIHSLGHTITNIQREIEADRRTKAVNANKELSDLFDSWFKRISDASRTISDALRFVKHPKDMLQEAEIVHEIRETIRIWYQFASAHKCNIRFRTPDAERTKVECYGFVIREILAVLIVNSVQASSRKIEISIRNHESLRFGNGIEISSLIEICVKDDGCGGIDPSDTEKLFSSTYTTKHERFGSGLGLYIARRLARTNQGDLEYAGKGLDGKGACFKVFLRLDRLI